MTRRPPNPFGTPHDRPASEERPPDVEPAREEPTEPARPQGRKESSDEHRPPSLFRDVPAKPEEPTEPPAPEPEAPESLDTEHSAPEREPTTARPTERTGRSEGPSWPEAPPRAPEAPRPGQMERGNIPVFDTLREAARIVLDHRGTILLPLLVVTVPVAALASIVTTFLFLTIWSDRPVLTTATLTTEAPAGMIFVLVLVTAVEALFAQVARGASIVAIAGSARGNPPALTEALDPAFSRIGGILVLVAVVVLIVGIGLLTIIGLVVMPYLLLRLAIAFDIYMVEGGTPWQALGRSWSLMHGNMLRLLGLLALAGISVLPFFVIISFIGGAIDGGRNVEILLLAVWGVVQAVLIVPIVAFFTACTTLYYLKTKAIEDGRGTA